MNKYPKGSLVRISFEFRQTADLSYHDPTAVFFSYRVERGNSVDLTYTIDADLVRDSIGIYHVDIDTSETGVYYTRAFSTGFGQAAQYRSFRVYSEHGL